MGIGRQVVRDADGNYSPVPVSMDEARSWKMYGYPQHIKQALDDMNSQSESNASIDKENLEQMVEEQLDQVQISEEMELGD